MSKLSAGPLPLLSVLLLALALRVWGLGWGLPSATHFFSYHPDESVVLETAMGMNVFAGRLLPHFYNYGSLQLYLVNFANTLVFLFGGVNIVIKDFATDYGQWARMYYIGRLLTVGMGVGTVWGVYALGTRLWGRRAGLLSALALAVMPLHAQHSHFLTVDVPATFWGILSLVWSARLAADDPKPLRAALLAGVFAGLATATKYNMALVFLPLAVSCFFLRSYSPRIKVLLGWGRGAILLAALAAFVLAFFIACPGAILENAKFVSDLRFESVHVQNVDDPTFRDTGNGFVYQIARNLDAGLGLPLLLLSLVSVGYALVRRERGDGLLAAFALPYYILISLAAVRYARYVIPLLPILALWTGRMVADWSRQPRSAFRWSALAASSVILLLTFVNVLALLYPMTRQDPRDFALIAIQGPRPVNGKGDIKTIHPRVGYATQPWFGTPPVSPYFSMPHPGAWREMTSPEIMQHIVYNGKDWDIGLLNAQRPDVVVLSEYDYDDPLRLKDPAAMRYFQVLRSSYLEDYDITFDRSDLMEPFDNPLAVLDCLPAAIDGMPTRGLPHDMLYTNPLVYLYYRKQ